MIGRLLTSVYKESETHFNGLIACGYVYVFFFLFALALFAVTQLRTFIRKTLSVRYILLNVKRA